MPDKPHSPVIDRRGMEAALRRAAQQARRTAAETNTPVVYVKNGEIVEEWVTLEQIEREEAALRQDAGGSCPS